jgi:hypothetical protein
VDGQDAPAHVPSWRSISRVEELDHARLRFTYQARNADGNPPFVN